MYHVGSVLLLRCIKQLSAIADQEQSRIYRLFVGRQLYQRHQKMYRNVSIPDFYSCNSANITHREEHECN